MEQLIKRLAQVGYKPHEAENLYSFYERMGDLDGLESYLCTKEETDQSLVGRQE